VLHVGEVPELSTSEWRLAIGGDVERPLELSWEEVWRLPQASLTAGMHGATGWTRLDVRWGGVRVAELLRRAGPREGARFLRARDGEGYEESIPLELARGPDVLLALELDGDLLPAVHGGPARLVVPSLYAFKSVKWLRSLEIAAEDRPGFWESRGSHPEADPWRELRLA
jgi:DMSO/TMAO reductase YedYZ molybdopterin-dependent catalytic subunit